MTPDTLELTFAPYGETTDGTPHTPHPTQQRILDWCRDVRAGRYAEHGIPCLYLQHGVNAGGTRALLTPALEYAFEQQGLHVLIARKDFQDLRLSGLQTFFEMVPADLLTDHDEQEHRYTVRAVGGTSDVFFRELKDIHGMGSQEFAVIVVQEAHEITLEMFRSLKRRCRQGQLPSMLLLEGNAPSEGHWTANLTNLTHPDYDPSITPLRMSSEENRAFMSPAYWTDLQKLPPMYYRRYVLGEVGGLPEGTPVYPSFIERLHVRETPWVPDRPLLRFWDFGLRATACAWAQQTDDGRLLLHREWCPRETPEEAFIDGVVARTNTWFGAIACKDYGDPAATHRDPNGVATLTRLRQRGIALVYRASTYGERIPLINKKFCELIRGEPAIWIHPRCRTLIDGLAGGYHYPTLQESQALTVARDKPFHDHVFSHICNCLEYGVVNLYGGTNTTTTSRRRERAAWQRRQMQPAVGTTAVF